MPKRTRDYSTKLHEDLRDSAKVVNYLNAALDDSEEMFLLALRDVAESYRIAKIAEDTGLAREALYKTLSSEGNPRFTSLTSILAAMNLKITIEPQQTVTPNLSEGPLAHALKTAAIEPVQPKPALGLLDRLTAHGQYAQRDQSRPRTTLLAYANH